MSATPLQKLLDAAGDLDQVAIAAATDDHLRSAVVQSVDALERMSDLAGLVAMLEGEWSTAVSSRSKLDIIIEESQPTPAIDGGLPDTGCRVSFGAGDSILVSEAPRQLLIEGLVVLHASMCRFERVSKMMIDSATAACRGEYVQSEFDKADHLQPQDAEEHFAPTNASALSA